MSAIIEVLEDIKVKLLGFKSFKEAEQFKNFMNVYINETNTVNAHNAYWIFSRFRIMEVKRFPDNVEKSLNKKFIEQMLFKILSARQAKPNPDMNVVFSCDSSEEGITFELGELPPRLKPEKGDKYRVIKEYLKKDWQSIHEGIVEKADEMYIYVKKSLKKELIKIPIEAVMKIG